MNKTTESMLRRAEKRGWNIRVYKNKENKKIVYKFKLDASPVSDDKFQFEADDDKPRTLLDEINKIKNNTENIKSLYSIILDGFNKEPEYAYVSDLKTGDTFIFNDDVFIVTDAEIEDGNIIAVSMGGNLVNVPISYSVEIIDVDLRVVR